MLAGSTDKIPVPLVNCAMVNAVCKNAPLPTSVALIMAVWVGALTLAVNRTVAKPLTSVIAVVELTNVVPGTLEVKR